MAPGSWMLSRAEDIRNVLQQPELFSSKGIAGFSRLVGESWDLIPLELDPPEHAKFRTILNGIFAPAKVNLARVVAMRGDQKRAEALLAEVLVKNPTSEPALAMAVSYKVRDGHVADAIGIDSEIGRVGAFQLAVYVGALDFKRLDPRHQGGEFDALRYRDDQALKFA